MPSANVLSVGRRSAIGDKPGRHQHSADAGFLKFANVGFTADTTAGNQLQVGPLLVNGVTQFLGRAALADTHIGHIKYDQRSKSPAVDLLDNGYGIWFAKHTRLCSGQAMVEIKAESQAMSFRMVWQSSGPVFIFQGFAGENKALHRKQEIVVHVLKRGDTGIKPKLKPGFDKRVDVALLLWFADDGIEISNIPLTVVPSLGYRVCQNHGLMRMGQPGGFQGLVELAFSGDGPHHLAVADIHHREDGFGNHLIFVAIRWEQSPLTMLS
jgi:hypothetical protein